MTLIAEDLLLLLLDDDSGSLSAAAQIRSALGGAVLAELAIEERVVVEAKPSRWRSAKVDAVGPPPLDPVLADAHAVVAEKDRSAQDLVERLGKGLKDRLIARLVEAGMVREEKSRVLGLLPRTRWPATSSTHEAEVRRALEDALLRGLDPDPRTGSLIALLSAVDQAHRVVAHPGMSNGEVKKRAKEIAQGEWAAKGVSDAIAAANAAVTAAIIASAVATTASSS